METIQLLVPLTLILPQVLRYVGFYDTRQDIVPCSESCASRDRQWTCTRKIKTPSVVHMPWNMMSYWPGPVSILLLSKFVYLHWRYWFSFQKWSLLFVDMVFTGTLLTNFNFTYFRFYNKESLNYAKFSMYWPQIIKF